jgi:soluble lytic murein transglycosylase-like protein
MKRLLIPAFLVGLALSAAPSRPLAGEVVPWQGLFIAAAGPRWVDRAAQVQAESGFNAAAVSSCGALGPAQWMPSSWADAIKKGWARPGSSPRDPAAAIPAQHAYMLWLEAYCGGLDSALGGYNAGPGSVRKAQRLAQALGLTDQAAWLRTLPRVTGEAHAGETRGYILHNANYRAQIRARLPARE